MNIETFLPYIKYLGIAGISILGIVLLLWLGLAITIMTRTQGVPKALNHFFYHIGQDQINQAYQLTTADYQRKISKQQFIKFIKTHDLKTNKRILIGIQMSSNGMKDIPVKVVLKSGKEIPTVIDIVKQDKTLLIDRLDLDLSSDS
ncbi:MAG: hypothetical protein GC158_07000 [Cyanobacteria bacterium RI_101]|nr:hypothetical protein [Cyanobacteria bacterium RI_101]